MSPTSTNRRNSRLSFASFRQILTRIRKSFLLRASSASIQFAATDPEARTNCRTSSALLRLFGNCLTNALTDSANRNVRSSRSRGFAPSSILGIGIWNLIPFTFNLELGIWNLQQQQLFALHRQDRPQRLMRGRFPSTAAYLARRLFLPNELRAAPTASLSSLRR